MPDALGGSTLKKPRSIALGSLMTAEARMEFCTDPKSTPLALSIYELIDFTSFGVSPLDWLWLKRLLNLHAGHLIVQAMVVIHETS